MEAKVQKISGVMVQDPDNADICAWLNAELQRVFPTPEDLLKDMRLEVQFRDVTYETLIEPGFIDSIRKAYPHVDWEKPFAEFNAAKER